MSKKLLLLISLIVIVALTIPLTIYLVRQQQDQRSRATPSTTLSFAPTPQTKNIGDEFTLTIKIDPGNNIVNFVGLDIRYDPTKFEVSGGQFQNNASALPIILQGPVYTEGRVRVNLSTGSDTTRALSDPADLGTITFTALEGTSGTPSEISFGDASSVTSIAGPSTGSDDSAGENVLASKNPAQITVSGGAVPTTIPTTEPSVPPTSPTLPPNTQPTTGVTSPSPSPEPTNSPAPTTPPQSTNTSPSPTSTLIAQGPTSTPTPIGGSVNSNSEFASDTPTPTIDATGPGTLYMGLGAIVAIFMLVGSLLFFTL